MSGAAWVPVTFSGIDLFAPADYAEANFAALAPPSHITDGRLNDTAMEWANHRVGEPSYAIIVGGEVVRHGQRIGLRSEIKPREVK